MSIGPAWISIYNELHSLQNQYHNACSFLYNYYVGVVLCKIFFKCNAKFKNII